MLSQDINLKNNPKHKHKPKSCEEKHFKIRCVNRKKEKDKETESEPEKPKKTYVTSKPKNAA